MSEQETGFKLHFPEGVFDAKVLIPLSNRIKEDQTYTKQLVYSFLSAYAEPYNLGSLAPSSEGKTYPAVTVAELFPRKDAMFLGGLSPTALIHDHGILVDASGNPIEDRIKVLNDRIAEHELGHALGEQHDYSNPANVMYYKITTKLETDVEESGVLSEGYSQFYLVCTHNVAAKYLFEVGSTVPLNIHIVPSKQDYQSFIGGMTFHSWPQCDAQKVTQYEQECSVIAGSGIILQNEKRLRCEVLGVCGQSAVYTIKIKEV